MKLGSKMIFKKNDNSTKSQQHIIDKIGLSIIRIVIVVLICIQVAVPIIGVYFNIYRERIGFQEVPDDYGMKYESVELMTDDNFRISGWYIPYMSKNDVPGIVLIHEIGTNRSKLLDIANILHNEGYAIFMFDLRGHGLSDGNKTTFGVNEYKDIKTSISYLVSRKGVDEERIGFYAVSYGASVLLQSIGRDDVISKYTKAAFLDSPYSNIEKITEERFAWHKGFITPLASFFAEIGSRFFIGDDPFDISPPIEAIKNIEIPIYFIHGSEDTIIPKSHSIELNQSKKFGYNYIWIAPLSRHLEAHLDYTEEYESKMIGFFNKHL